MTLNNPTARGPLDTAWKRDAVCAAVIAVAAGMVTWIAFRTLAPAITHASTFDYWFESDAPAIVRQLADRFAVENERAHRHPLFTLALYPIVFALHRVGPTDFVTATGITYAGIAALWSALFFQLLRLLNLRRIDAFIFTALAYVASAALFWLPIPETFSPASLTLLIALAALAWHENTGRMAWIGCVLVGAVTLSMTVTHALAGFLICVLVAGWRRGGYAIGAATALVAVGQFVERLLFPRTEAFFLPGGEIDSSAYLLSPLAGSFADRLAGFFLHSVIVPPLQQGYTAYLSVQSAAITTAPAATMFGWAIWMLLFGAGIYGLFSSARLKFVAVLAAVLASQLGLALVFGLETFLYALQSGPLLVAVAAFGSLTRARSWVLTGAVVLGIVAGVQNGSAFLDGARRLHHRYETAHAYSQALSSRTVADDLIVVGLPPAAAYGWPVPSVEPGKPVRLRMLPRFDDTPLERRGWNLHYERWSPETLEQLRSAGAAFFVSNYRYGIEREDDVTTYLSTRGRLIERTRDWAIYELPRTATP